MPKLYLTLVVVLAIGIVMGVLVTHYLAYKHYTNKID
jgi:hypothetical protein